MSQEKIESDTYYWAVDRRNKELIVVRSQDKDSCSFDQIADDRVIDITDLKIIEKVIPPIQEIHEFPDSTFGKVMRSAWDLLTYHINQGEVEDTMIMMEGWLEKYKQLVHAIFKDPKAHTMFPENFRIGECMICTQPVMRIQDHTCPACFNEFFEWIGPDDTSQIIIDRAKEVSE